MTIALFGATAIVAQVLLLRESLIVAAGNELFLALFFGAWFVGITAGAAAGALRKSRVQTLPNRIAVCLLLQIVLLPVLMISLRGVRSAWGLPAWQWLPLPALLQIAALHLCPFSFLTGLTFPMLCRLLAAQSAQVRVIGRVYAVESLGSLVGGIAATLVVGVYCEPLTAAWALGALTAANLICFLHVHKANGRRPWTLAAAAVGAVFAAPLLIAPIRQGIEQRAAQLRHRAYGEGFDWLAERYTPYQHLALAHQGPDQFSLLSNGQFIASFPDPYGIRQRVHLMMSQCGKAHRVLVIGGGESGALTVLLRYPNLAIDYVETDPAVLDMVLPYLEREDRQVLETAAKAFCQPPKVEDPAIPARLRIFHEDARHLVRRLSLSSASSAASIPLYDAILCNAPDPATAALNRFYTRDFFQQARSLLGDRGVFVTSIASSVNYFDEQMQNYVGSVYQALHEAFGHVLATPGARAFLFATAAADHLTSNPAVLAARYEARGVADPEFSPLYFQTAYEHYPLGLLNGRLQRMLGHVRANTDFEPATYLHFLRLWSQFSGTRQSWFFRAVQHYDWRYALAACAVAVLLAAVVGLRRLKRSSNGLQPAAQQGQPLDPCRGWGYPAAVGTLAAAGMVGMAASIILLLLYQNFHGALYRQVGLLVALFMAGLTGGSLAANRFGSDSARPLLVRLGLCAAAFSLFLSSIAVLAATGAASLWFGHALVFPLAMIAAGALTGAQFSLVGRFAAACVRDVGRAGGVLESADHLGACAGAFLTGIVLIPVSGIAASLAVVAGVELAAGAIVLASARS
ncbi:MAG: hypothetical protein N3D11_16165 [Candidatus Sumerlaeia bacterium]|nr:hypothetical protein [Candidatus Sumerlaeia bacterium]